MDKPVKRGTVTLLVVIFSCGLCVGSANAGSGFEFYFFGQNLKTFQNCNLAELVVGAVASVAAHELGHALYAELAGKSWELEASVPSGFAVHSNDSFSDREYRDFGRSGFALQTVIGVVLTSFEKTRNSDFTKGWVGMNAIEASAYKIRPRNGGDDFDLVDRGGGNGDIEYAVVSVLSLNNLRRLEPDLIPSLTKYGIKSNAGFPYQNDASLSTDRNVFFSEADVDQQTSLLSETDLEEEQPQNISTEVGPDASVFTAAEWEPSHFAAAQKNVFARN
jgi:hypothetical protein